MALYRISENHHSRSVPDACVSVYSVLFKGKTKDCKHGTHDWAEVHELEQLNMNFEDSTYAEIHS